MNSEPSTAVSRAYDAIRSSIRTGALVAGSRVDEAELVADLDTSRTTVRAALARLSHDGIVRRRQRSGTTIEVAPARFTSRRFLGPVAAHPAQEAESTLTTTVVFDRIDLLPDAVGRRISAPSGRVRVVSHVASSRGEPIILRTLYSDADAPAETIGAADGCADTDFEHRFGIPLDRIETVVEAVPCDAQTAAVLRIRPGSPILLREQVLVGIDAVARLLSLSHYRGDRATFVAGF